MERVFHGHDAINDVAVHSVPSDIGEDDLKVTAVLNPEATLTEEELCAWVVERVPYFAVPRYIEFRDDLPAQPGRPGAQVPAARRGRDRGDLGPGAERLHLRAPVTVRDARPRSPRPAARCVGTVCLFVGRALRVGRAHAVRQRRSSRPGPAPRSTTRRRCARWWPGRSSSRWWSATGPTSSPSGRCSSPRPTRSCGPTPSATCSRSRCASRTSFFTEEPTDNLVVRVERGARAARSTRCASSPRKSRTRSRTNIRPDVGAVRRRVGRAGALAPGRPDARPSRGCSRSRVSLAWVGAIVLARDRSADAGAARRSCSRWRGVLLLAGAPARRPAGGVAVRPPGEPGGGARRVGDLRRRTRRDRLAGDARRHPPRGRGAGDHP